MAINYVKAGDTEPPIEEQLVDSAGDPIDLTGASVVFTARHQHESIRQVDEATASITDASNGWVAYNQAAADFPVAGLFLNEWTVTFPGGKVETFPQLYYSQVIVEARL